MALTALACGGRTTFEGFENEWENPGSGANGSGATGSGATGSGATGSGTGGAGPIPGAGATGGFAGTGALTGSGGVATGGAFGVGATAGVGAIGGVGGVGTAGTGGAVNACPALNLPSSNIIHQFEHVGPDVYVYNDNGFDDTPWSYGTIFPAVGSDLTAGLKPAFEGNGFNLLGSAFTPDSWGAGLGVATECISGAGYAGIGFHLKSDVWVRVSVTMPENLPYFDGGECPGDYSTCVQNYIDVQPYDRFKFVSIPWSRFSNGTPASFDPTRILGVNFQALPPFVKGGFDLWVDRVAFL